MDITRELTIGLGLELDPHLIHKERFASGECQTRLSNRILKSWE